MNGMIYTRGLKEEYDKWNIPGWSYGELECFFKRSEGHTDITDSAAVHGLTGVVSPSPFTAIVNANVILFQVHGKHVSRTLIS